MNFYRSYFSFFFLFVFAQLASGASFVDTIRSQRDVEYVRGKCRQLLLSDVKYANEQSYSLTDDIIYDKDGDGYFKFIRPDGSFTDSDYHSPLRNSWKLSWHFIV